MFKGDLVKLPSPKLTKYKSHTLYKVNLRPNQTIVKILGVNFFIFTNVTKKIIKIILQICS